MCFLSVLYSARHQHEHPLGNQRGRMIAYRVCVYILANVLVYHFLLPCVCRHVHTHTPDTTPLYLAARWVPECMCYKQVETRVNSRGTFREGTGMSAWMQLRQPGGFLRTSDGDSDWRWNTRHLDSSQEEEVAKMIQGYPVQRHKNEELPSPCARLSALAVPCTKWAEAPGLLCPWLLAGESPNTQGAAESSALGDQRTGTSGFALSIPGCHFRGS